MFEGSSRSVQAVLAVGAFLAVASALLLSDRAPQAITVVGDAVVEAGRGIESQFDVDVIDRDDIPGRRDEIGHALLWGTGMAIVGFAARRKVPVSITAVILAGVSLLSEYGQEVLSSTRVAQVSDAIANVVGIAIAAVLLGVLLSAVRLVDRFRNRWDPDTTGTAANGVLEPALAPLPLADSEPAYTYRFDAERIVPDVTPFSAVAEPSSVDGVSDRLDETQVLDPMVRDATSASTPQRGST